MSGFLTAPTFTPPVGPIVIGHAGSVLTVVAGVPVFASGAGVTFATRYAYASPSGASNNVNPGTVPNPFPGGANFLLIVSLAAGNANWTGLNAGVQGQQGFVYNNDTTNSLTLNNGNAGSLAANRFAGRNTNDALLPPKTGGLIIYDATLGWLLV